MILKIILIAAIVYGALLLLAYVFQTRLLFFPTRQLYRTPQNMGWAYEDVLLPVDRETTHGWWIPHPSGTQNTVLFSHGNAGNIADRLESCSIFRDLGLNVLVYDYGGYGQSTGTPSEFRCYADVRAMWRWLVNEQGVPPQNVILFGRSLGAGPTAHLATEVQPAAIILESAFASVPDMAQTVYPMFPARLLVRHRFDNAAKAPLFTAPVLIIHSRADSIIPYSQGRKLYDAAPQPKYFLDLDGDHNDGFVLTGARYTQGLRKFIEPLVQRDSP